MSRWSFISLAVWLSVPMCCIAQRYTFKPYTLAEGLRNLNVTAMLEDKEGFIWAATQNGVFRYDGFRFEEIGLEPGSPTRTINALHQDEQGRIWVGLENTIEVFDGNRFHRVQDLPITTGSVFSSSPDGRLFAVSGTSLFEFTQSSSGAPWQSRVVPIRDSTAPHSLLTVRSVLAEQNGSLILGCGKGICRLTGDRLESWEQKQGLVAEEWTELFRDSNGDLWARGHAHIAVLKRGENTFKNRDLPGVAADDDFFEISEDSQGRIVTFSGNRLALWESGAWKIFDEGQGLPDYKLSAMLIDHNGEVWLGSLGHGIVKWLGYGQWEHWTTAEGLQDNIVWAILRDRSGRLWVGSEDGLAVLEPGANRFVPWRIPSQPRNARVQSLAESQDGGIWAALSGSSICRIGSAGHKPFRADVGAKIYRILADKRGRIWAATMTGVYMLDASRTDHLAGKPPIVLSLAKYADDIIEAPDGQLFARTDTGLFRFDGSVWHNIQLAAGLQFGGSWSDLAADKANSLWTDGASGGVVHMTVEKDRVVKVERYTAESLGSTEEVIVTTDRHGRIWVGNDVGVSFRDGQKWLRLTQEQGLLWNDCDSKAFFEDSDGSIWIGTSGGLSHLLTVKPYLEPRELKLISTSATFGTANLAPGSQSSLSWNRAPLLIQMAAPAFHEGSGLKLRYRLLGLEQNWIETANREIRYPQLAPGAYTFEALATDTSRGWDSAVYRLSFVINPPWWRTKIALVLDCLFCLTSIVLLWRWRVRSLVARQRELERMVTERTEELDNKKVEAESANRAKSDFLARMSHEIRTPLNGVIGMTSILRQTALDDDQMECVDTIANSGDLLLTVLNDILDFSKVEAGKLELETLPFDLRQTIRECSYLLSEPARKKGLHLAFEMDPQLPDQVLGDPTRISQILLNLLSNAVKFTAHGQVALKVSTELPASPDKLKLRFEVSDTGPGMKPDTLNRLFTSFSQAEASTSRQYGGTGLGLAICKQLVELMGGVIGASSELDEGSVFWFVIELTPVRALELSAKQIPSTETPISELARIREKTRWHILVAEDNAVNTKVIARLLALLGHTSEYAVDGVQAVALARRKNFDLILMDCQMPLMDGIEATKTIREEEIGQRIPIIAVTASALPGERMQWVNAGMDDVLPKPFKKEELEKMLNRWLASGERISNSRIQQLATGGELGADAALALTEE